jgi:transcriptional regulator with XRE-family HTH domain
MNVQTIGARIRALRIKRNIGLLELAKRINVSEACLRHLELGQHGSNMFTFIEVARALGVTTDYLAYGDVVEAQKGTGHYVDFAAFGARMMQLRRLRDMTQQQMAELLGVQVAIICAWERGDKYPTYDSIRKIVAATECDAHWLISGVCYSDFQRLHQP